MSKSKFKCRDLNNLTAKEEGHLLRIYAGKNASHILTKEQLEKAISIWKERK
jgi:hypothetical protein